MSSDVRKMINKLKNLKFLNENVDGVIKSGVDYVYNQYPELSNIGTREQYSKYIDTIFPNSRIKNIVYHSSPNKFEKFRENMFGIYFSYSPILNTYGDKIYSVVLNVKNILNIPDSVEARETYNREYRNYNNPTHFTDEGIGVYKYDASIEPSTVTKEGVQIRVRNPEQIHILGSQKDVEMFKTFLKK